MNPCLIGYLLVLIIILLIVFDYYTYPDSMDLFLRLKDDLRIIQLGGHIGPQWFGGRDPIYRLIFHPDRNDQAIIVEPIQSHFKQLKENYKDYMDRVLPLNIAICEKGKHTMEMYVPNQDYFGTNRSTTASMNKSHLLKHGQTNYTTETVSCMDMESLLNKYNREFKSNMLIIDVEGYEYPILSTIPWNNFQPNIISFENKHMTQNEKENIHRILIQNGYSIESNGKLDIIYVHSSYLKKWKIDTMYSTLQKTSILKTIIYMIFTVFVSVFIYLYYSKYVAYIIGIFLFAIILIKNLPETMDRFLHTKIIHIPHWIKCHIDINCGDTCKLKGSNDWEHQTNADIDLYTIGHIIFWALIAYFEKKVTFLIVLILSILWEIAEIILGCYGYPLHGRLTDILVNLIGFTIGRSIFKSV